jgi:hypothetical protein
VIIEQHRSYSSLLDDDGLDRALVGRLLDGILMLGRDFIDDDLCHIVTHLENFGAGIAAKPTSGAGIFNSDYHSNTPYAHLIFRDRRRAVRDDKWIVITKSRFLS